MKISELSLQCDVPLPTIKFYIRQGLLPPGRKTGRNQADYGQRHVERLALIRALRDDAGLPIEVIARSMRAADATRGDVVLAAMDALERPMGNPVDTQSAAYKRAERLVLAVTRAQGWKVRRGDASVATATRALAVISSAFREPTPEMLAPYLKAARDIAAFEVPDDWSTDDPEPALRYGMLGTVLYEPLILALRRMAHVDRGRHLEQLRRSPKKGRARRT